MQVLWRNNRLLTETTVKESKTETSEYAYDPNGNQLSKLSGVVTDVITVGDAPQGVPLTGLGIYELSEAYENGFTYVLDEYDVFNRLIGVQKDGKTAKYAYKANGLRLSKEVDGQKTNHIWDGGNIVLDVGANNDRYIRGINLIKSDSNGFYIYNAHGDVVQLTDGIGAVTKNYHYDAFGVETNKDEADNNPFRYCAEYFDKETDTIYLRNRYYAPITGRFSAEDPVKSGLNYYTYCGNRPIMYIDPLGLYSILGSEVIDKLTYKAFMLGAISLPSNIALRLIDKVRTEEKLFIATIFAETSTSSNQGGIAVANVIMNRVNNVGTDEWIEYESVTDVITKTGFDAYKFNDQNFRDAMDYLNGNPISSTSTNDPELVKKYVDKLKELCLPVYYGETEDITNGAVYYFSPMLQAEMNKVDPIMYPMIPSFITNKLEVVKVIGCENDDLQFYRFK